MEPSNNTITHHIMYNTVCLCMLHLLSWKVLPEKSNGHAMTCFIPPENQHPALTTCFRVKFGSSFDLLGVHMVTQLVSAAIRKVRARPTAWRFFSRASSSCAQVCQLEHAFVQKRSWEPPNFPSFMQNQMTILQRMNLPTKPCSLAGPLIKRRSFLKTLVLSKRGGWWAFPNKIYHSGVIEKESHLLCSPLKSSNVHQQWP